MASPHSASSPPSSAGGVFDFSAAARGAAGGLAKMMRTKVSADKKRYQNEKFDLDLTYITDRLIGTQHR